MDASGSSSYPATTQELVLSDEDSSYRTRCVWCAIAQMNLPGVALA